MSSFSLTKQCFLGIYIFTYIFILSTYLHKDESEKVIIKVYPLQGWSTKIPAQWPVCRSVPKRTHLHHDMCAERCAETAEIESETENILQNLPMGQSFPLHHQWCQQENSFITNFQKYPRSFKLFKKNLYWERKISTDYLLLKSRLHLHEYVKWSNIFARSGKKNELPDLGF